MKRPKWYVGHKGTSAIAFASVSGPTQHSHGSTYNAVTGPFRTKRAAQFMAKYGRNNPHCLSVHDAERLAAKHIDQYAANDKHWPNSLSV